jgi:porin
VSIAADRGSARRTRSSRRRAVDIALAALALGALASGTAQRGYADAAGPGLPADWLEADRLLDDPAGARSRLERLGVDIQLFYNQFLSGKPAGHGADPDGLFGHNGSYDFLALVDFEALAGWPGADVVLHVKGQYDRNINAGVGALSDPIDDADFDEPIYVGELWIQQALFDRRVRLRIGFVEQQTVYDRNAYANSEDRQFLASFLDNNAGVPLPSGLAANVLLTPAAWLELALGVADADNRPRRAGFDTAFDGLASLTAQLEARVRSPWQRFGLGGSYRLGVFVDGRKLRDFRTGRQRRSHVGAYLGFDQLVWRPHAGGPGGHESLGLFARAGYADPDVNRIAWFWSVGLEYRGPIPGRDRDVMGFGAYQTIGSARYRDAVDSRFERETGLELYYAVRALGWLVITPDLQYIVEPGATGARADAFIGTLRFRVTF